MSNKFKCPICKIPMIPVNNAQLICSHDKFIADVEKRSAYFMDDAPRHLKESQKFLQEFQRIDPVYVFSPTKLFDEGFELDDCIFVKDATRDSDVKVLSAYRLKPKEIAEKLNLIAGGRIVAYNCLNYFIKGVFNEISDNPLCFSKIPDYDTWLWVQTCVVSAEEEYLTAKHIRTLSAYFAPNLEEAAAQYLPDEFDSKVELPSDEAVLFSMLFCTPQINIKWGKGFNELHDNTLSYVKALVTDGKDHHYFAKPVAKEGSILTQGTMFDEFAKAYLMSMPSTAVNNAGLKENEFAWFDILNDEYATDVYSGISANLNNTMILQLFNTYNVQAALVKKYTGDAMKYDIKWKQAYVLRLSNKMVDLSDDTEDYYCTISTFWDYVKTSLELEYN